MKPPVPPPLLFVDGYNIIGAWPQLSELRDYDSLESARYSLIEALANYSAYQGFQTRIVFDAYTQKHVSAEEVVTDGVSVHYTHFGQTADTCIEKWCAELRHHIRFSDQRLIVATSDHAQKLTVTGYGAEWMSAQTLALEVNATTHRRRKHHRSKGFQRTSKRLSNVLKPGVYNQLKTLRAQLEQ